MTKQELEKEIKDLSELLKIKNQNIIDLQRESLKLREDFKIESKSHLADNLKNELKFRKLGVNSMPYLSNDHVQALINVMQGKV